MSLHCANMRQAVLRITSSKWIKSPWIWSQLVSITADDWIAALIKKTAVCHNRNLVWNVLHKACLASFLVHGCFMVFLCHLLGCYDKYLTMLHYWQLNTVNVLIPSVAFLYHRTSRIYFWHGHYKDIVMICRSVEDLCFMWVSESFILTSEGIQICFFFFLISCCQTVWLWNEIFGSDTYASTHVHVDKVYVK